MSENFVIHIVDDDAAVRDSLKFVLESANWQVRDYESATALLSALPTFECGLIITDVRMPSMSGLELVDTLRERGSSLPIIVLTGHADVAMAVDAMKAGVVDFIEKPFNDDALLSAISSAKQRIDGVAGRQAERTDIDERVATLTAREKDVFDAVVAGDFNKAAALRLGISPRTVEIYRANVMEKMKARSLSDLVRMALLADRPV